MHFIWKLTEQFEKEVDRGCHKGAMQVSWRGYPRGMVAATTDLQMRSLTEEDEEEVGFIKTSLFACCNFDYLT